MEERLRVFLTDCKAFSLQDAETANNLMVELSTLFEQSGYEPDNKLLTEIEQTAYEIGIEASLSFAGLLYKRAQFTEARVWLDYAAILAEQNNSEEETDFRIQYLRGIYENYA